MIKNVLMFLMLIISVSLVALILMQKRGSGVGAAFGGGSSGSYRSRRGAEKFLHYLTIILAVLFSSISFTLLLI